MLDWMLAAALQFPTIEARDLNGKAVSSRDLTGAPAVVALGFSYDSRRQVEPWTKQLVEGTRGQLRIIVMPVMKGVPGPVAALVEGAMARTTPAALRAYVWITADHEGLSRGLGLPASTDAAIVLLDGAQTVKFVARGAPTPGALRSLLDTWRGLGAVKS